MNMIVPNDFDDLEIDRHPSDVQKEFVIDDDHEQTIERPAPELEFKPKPYSKIVIDNAFEKTIEPPAPAVK